MSLFVVFQRVLPKVALTVLAGCVAEIKFSPVKNFLIKIFRRAYNVDMSEAVRKTADEFISFNDFFTRELEAQAREISKDPSQLVSPADGCVSELGHLQDDKLIQAKGLHYSVDELLADSDFGREMASGSFATIYLSPKDYHRVHVPISGHLIGVTYVPGKLFSVNDATARSVDGLFSRNERLVARFQTDSFSYALVMVGALIVGGMETVVTGRIKRQRSRRDFTFDKKKIFATGSELGRFHLGSTAIVVLPKSAESIFESSLAAGSSIKMGEPLARLKGGFED